MNGETLVMCVTLLVLGLGVVWSVLKLRRNQTLNWFEEVVLFCGCLLGISVASLAAAVVSMTVGNWTSRALGGPINTFVAVLAVFVFAVGIAISPDEYAEMATDFYSVIAKSAFWSFDHSNDLRVVTAAAALFVWVIGVTNGWPYWYSLMPFVAWPLAAFAVPVALIVPVTTVEVAAVLLSRIDIFGEGPVLEL